MEPIVVITTEKDTLDPGTLPFVPAAREEQTSEDPPPEEVPIPLKRSLWEQLKFPQLETLAQIFPRTSNLLEDADVAEPVGPVGGVTSCSGRVIHPLDCSISDSVWAQM